MSVKVSAIAAVEQYHRGLAKNGRIPWNIQEDQSYFKSKVKGHVVIMGRKTYDEIRQVPLTDRPNIVITRQKALEQKGFIFVNNIDDALRVARNEELRGEVFIVGGGEIYKMGLPYTDRLYLTLVDGTYGSMETTFPDYNDKYKTVISDSGVKNSGGYKYSFVVLEK
ncbi:MAG: dihydrofolate reductase [candidate division SR1 bacterium]|nr:dihydrofolate reductase [candidate division SR1 bacterium]